MEETATGNSLNAFGDYLIEISGWDTDNCFFVERVNLAWTAEGEKQIHLLRKLSEGAMIFVRSISFDASSMSVPLAYKIKKVMSADHTGTYRMDLVKMAPRSQESLHDINASNRHEGNESCETKESGTALEHEEILP